MSDFGHDPLRGKPRDGAGQPELLHKELDALTRKLDMVNQRLQESEAVQSSFLSHIRNELVDPLTSIRGLAWYLQSLEAKDGESACHVAELIEREALEADFLLRNVITAAEVEAGECTLEVCRVHVPSMVTSVLQSIRYGARDKDIDVSTQGDMMTGENDPWFLTDGGKLELVARNLFSNAVKFSGPGSAVVVRVLRDATDLRLSVRDEGTGIERCHHERIFERFTQLSKGSGRAYRGLGLGLSVVKALVEMLGGRISFSSTPGAGSEFSVDIPENMPSDAACALVYRGNFLVF
ncbi:MAG: HAMP domain-containing sensor histidine kinase [Nitrospirota bacterium]|jgi:signal transduction histidine kinase